MSAPGIVEQQIIGRALHAVAEEMGINLLRNAFSSIVREAKDMSTALFDADGVLIAQPDHIPILLSAMTTAIGACLEQFDPDEMTEDTILVTNDPYRGCHHLNDIALFMPVFAEGRRIAFVGSIAHHIDVGGAAPGILPRASEIYEEGKIIPPLRMRLDNGRFPALFEQLITANVRVPDETTGDLNAQLVALFSGRSRLQALARRYGSDTICATMTALVAASESVMRATLESLDDFDVEGSAWLDDDGIGGPEMVVRTRLTKTGGTLVIDFAGTDAQRPCMMNANLSSTLGAVWTIVRQVLGAGIEMWHNAGAVRPIEVRVPEGSFLNPLPPASVHGRIITAYRVYDAVMDALQKAIPDRVMATGFNSSICLALSRMRDGRFDIFVEVLSGGWGARNGSDGPNALPFPLSNCSNAPTEYVERQFPFLRIRRYGLEQDSCGPGQWRGGAGEIREYDVLEDDVLVTVFTDRFKYGAPGAAGGGDGLPGRIEVERGNELIPLASKTGFLLKSGDRLRMVGGGGGGYGPPGNRARAASREDRMSGLVTAESVM
ncbi:N-methylhydantoinase B [Rhodoligotrophos appendicifer]|uniref:hydantoinase B/oxoprolinase family protein n=1 Tax=Rhodoligotrophos appendicifer TaxID=987056 RepID=UPI00118529C1|nr:hydantoinase B/oxoprolinase family protein [Rhodoligotrophos appendicifer]